MKDSRLLRRKVWELLDGYQPDLYTRHGVESAQNVVAEAMDLLADLRRAMEKEADGH